MGGRLYLHCQRVNLRIKGLSFSTGRESNILSQRGNMGQASSVLGQA